MNFFDALYACLAATSPELKVQQVRDTATAWRRGELSLDASRSAPPQAGRPAHPRLVRPRELPQRRFDTPQGRGILFHALTHIEFTAINLALDAAARFPELPRAYYDDWLRIAEEEALHFELLRTHLRTFGYDYGDLPAHGGLWEMAEATAHDPLARMALVPRCLEARGLDVNPGIHAKLLSHGDTEGAALLEIILRDEVGHVAAGDRWFRHLCEQRRCDPVHTYRDLLGRYLKGGLRGPFHLEARRAAGFSEDELAALAASEQ